MKHIKASDLKINDNVRLRDGVHRVKFVSVGPKSVYFVTLDKRRKSLPNDTVVEVL